MAAPMAGKFDGNLCDILQNVQQIDTFLDVIFEFLYRRTDFYKLMRHEHDTMGLPPGMAKKLLMKAFTKYEKIGHGFQIPELENLSTGVPNPSNTVEITEITDVENSTNGNTESKTRETEQEKERLADRTNEGEEQEAAEEGLSLETTRQKTTQQKRASEIIMSSDTYNGALRDQYAWSQTLGDLDVKVFVPETLKKAKDLIVDIKEDSIKVTIQGHHTGSAEPQVLVDAKLTMKIRCDESMWSLHPGNYVQLSLEKHKETWWCAVIEGEPEIDKKSIDKVQSVTDMDEDAQQDYERVMFDMEQKRQGKPTIKEKETHDVLRKAWNAEGSPFKGTEFDPSRLNITT